jgi:autotransporter-associated beta strand protein
LAIVSHHSRLALFSRATGFFKFVCSIALLIVVCGTAERAVGQTRSLGVDISAWQGNLSQSTWNSFAGAGNRDFAFIRSSRGGTTGYYNQSNASNTNPPGQNTLSQRYDDPYFVQNITRAMAAGMLAGPYHFGRMDIIESTLNANGIANNGSDEADHFIQMAGPWMRPGYLLPVFDLEAGINERTPNELAQFAIDFSDRIYEVMDIRPFVYIGGNYAADIQNASASLRNELVQKYPNLWTPRYANQSDPDSIPVQTAHPKDYTSGVYGPWDDYGTTHPWSFWQYASTGQVPGYGGNLDVNVAQGGMEFLKDKFVPAVWMNDSNGDWSILTNWNSGITPVAPVQGPGQVARVGTLVLPETRLPTSNDTVILDKPASDITVNLSSGNHDIRKLYARESLNITGGSLNIGYVPSADSTPISAQFSADVTLGGDTALSVHTLQVDATRTFTLEGGTFTFNRVNMLPHATTPAKLLVSGDITVNPLNDASAVISNSAGSGSSAFVDLGGDVRRITVGDGLSGADLTVSMPITNGGLIKDGAGTVRLTGASTYAGDTSVEEGMLRLYSPFLSNTADLYLSTGGSLDLNFNGSPDVIDGLFIDGEAQAIGIWGGLSSGAEFTTPLITGTGLLQVTSTIFVPVPGDFNGDGFVDGNDLLQWQQAFGIDDAGDADSDGDTDGQDYLIWQRNFTAGEPLAAATAVPEPTSLCFVVLALGAVCFARR